MTDNYLSSIKKQFEFAKSLGEKTFEQLEEDALFWRYNEESNSIAIIVNHLAGNMLSRWTNFLSSDGEKQWRKREQEFEEIIQNKTELIAKWNEGWNCLFNAINQIDESNFSQVIYIRNQGHTIIEALNRQLGHYSYHLGQIVFIGKMIKRNNWNSISIPKGGSEKYNQEKFLKEKSKAQFTDEFLNKNRNK